MKKIEAFDSFKKVNESKLTNEELLDFVHKLGYESIDDIKKEKSKLAKLEALFNELNMDNGEKAKKVDEDDLTSGSGEGSATGSDTGSAAGTDTTSGTGSATGSDTTSAAGTDTTSSTGSDTGSAAGTDTTSSTGDAAATVGDTTTNTEAKPKSMHIKSFAEFCGEVEEDKEAKTNSDTMNESEIKSDEQFREYAMNILKKAHPEDFNEEEANKTIEDLLKDHNGDYGAAIGALNNGLSK